MNRMHHWLVEKAFHWLRDTKCSVIIAGCGVEERPDVIGWDWNADSIVIECKASRKDLVSEWNRKKIRAVPCLGMGRRRYYMVPYEILDKNLEQRIVPTGWGILTAHSVTTSLHVPSTIFEYNISAEMRLLVRNCSDVLPKEPPHPQIPLKL